MVPGRYDRPVRQFVIIDGMAGNTFGKLFRVTTSGVSHGPGYVVAVPLPAKAADIGSLGDPQHALRDGTRRCTGVADESLVTGLPQRAAARGAAEHPEDRRVDVLHVSHFAGSPAGGTPSSHEGAIGLKAILAASR